MCIAPGWYSLPTLNPLFYCMLDLSTGRNLMCCYDSTARLPVVGTGMTGTEIVKAED